MQTTTFSDKEGRQIEIMFDEEQLTCVAYHDGVLLGTFSFNEEAPDTDSTLLLLTHCHIEMVPGYKAKGIGEQMIRLPVECGYTIFAQSHDGIQRDDGSHLTEDAPGFIATMVKKGLVNYACGWDNYDNRDD